MKFKIQKKSRSNPNHVDVEDVEYENIELLKFAMDALGFDFRVLEQEGQNVMTKANNILNNRDGAQQAQPIPVQPQQKPIEKIFNKGGMKFKLSNNKLYVEDWKKLEKEYRLRNIKNDKVMKTDKVIVEILDWVEVKNDG